MHRLWLLALLVSCVQAGSTICSEGYVCPAGLVCATVGAQNYCVDERQIGCIESAPCLGDMGTCHENVCLPNVCGNNLVDTNEVCDDGNFDDDDMCSATCLSNNQCGNGTVDPVKGEQCDSGVAGMSGDGCTSTCDVEALSWRDVTPRGTGGRANVAMAYDSAGHRTVLFGGLTDSAIQGDMFAFDGSAWTPLPSAVAPSPRAFTSMTYDSTRNELVLFGGFGLTELGDTWTFDGTAWRERTSPTSPGPRQGAVMAYHAGRDETVLFGGIYGGFLGDTWLWNGTTWTQDMGTTHPPAPVAGRMAYDPVGGVVIWYGSSQTWTWNGSWVNSTGLGTPPTDSDVQAMATSSIDGGIIALGAGATSKTWKWTSAAGWTQLAPASRPPTASGSGMADGPSGPIFFGGSLANNMLSPNTYRWTGLDWNQVLSPPSSPPPRESHAMAYDARHGEIVMFGGGDSKGILHDDTWRWRNGSWRLESDGSTTSFERAFHSMAYDSARDRVVLFGGSSSSKFVESATTKGDTLEWNGTQWVDRQVTGPGPRRLAAMAYDSDRELTVLFGGATAVSTGSYQNDMWSWNGSQWLKLTPASSPPAREGAAIAYDPLRKRIVIFGGASQYQPLAAHGDTWEWDGSDWTQMQPTVSPPARVQATMSFDPGRGRIVLAGGRGTAGSFADVWEWDGATWTQLTPSGAPGPILTAIYDNVGQRLIAYGDSDYFGPRDTTWALEFSTPIANRTACLDGTSDEDGDGLVGCSDPDCWARCSPLCPPRMQSCPMTAPRCGDGACDPLEDAAICAADCN